MTSLHIASREDFQRTIQFGKTAESKHLEFKKDYGWRSEHRAEQALELCRDVAQFANADGGVGALRRKVDQSPPPAQAFPVDDESRLSLLKVFNDPADREQPLLSADLEQTLNQLILERRETA